LHAGGTRLSGKKISEKNSVALSIHGRPVRPKAVIPAECLRVLGRWSNRQSEPEDTTMDSAKTASRDEWRAARNALVAELTRLRDQLTTDPCALPWNKVEKECLGRFRAA
jgi:hypothetical protein